MSETSPHLQARLEAESLARVNSGSNMHELKEVYVVVATGVRLLPKHGTNHKNMSRKVLKKMKRCKRSWMSCDSTTQK